MSKLYDEITNKLILEIENHPHVWESGISFINSIPVNISGNEYNGINVLILCFEKYNKQFEHNKWITYNKIKYLKAELLKDQSPTNIIFYSPPEVTVHTVYNISQVTNLPSHYYDKQSGKYADWTSDEKGDALYKSSDCHIEDKYGPSGHPCYISGLDVINQPLKAHFNNAENYYSTLAHEMIHSTLHETRLNRKSKNYSYAYEELVAEIGACFICAELNIHGSLENHASYIKSWLEALRNDNKMIFKASKDAQLASKYILTHLHRMLNSK